jgi:2-polyprenyl-6-methoxyphenol hydroxylase-like FAD-dependent oxidoreductase
MLLARQGFRVDVFERLAPLVGRGGEVRASIGPRSYHILLTERAITALEGAGADLQGFDIPDLAYGLRHRWGRGAAWDVARATVRRGNGSQPAGIVPAAAVQQARRQVALPP